MIVHVATQRAGGALENAAICVATESVGPFSIGSPTGILSDSSAHTVMTVCPTDSPDMLSVSRGFRARNNRASGRH